jgi:ribosomal-protein-alanine N-acetyltransferase
LSWQFVRIRPAELTDMPFLLEIERSCFAGERFDASMLENILTGEGCESFVGLERDAVISSAMIFHDKGIGSSRIVSIAVLPKHQGKGHGRELLELLERMADRAGSKLLALEVRVTNVPAINLYLESGYRIEGMIRNYFGRGEDALYMEKTL